MFTKKLSLSQAGPLSQVHYWLLGIMASYVGLHLNYIWRSSGTFDELSLAILLWCGFFVSLWEKRKSLRLESSFLASLIGLILIGLIMIRNLVGNLYHTDSLLDNISPLIFMPALALLASGFKGIKQYQRELLIILAVSIPTGYSLILLSKFVDLVLLSAQFATLLLWYLGFDVERQGYLILLPPKGVIEVYSACSAAYPMLMLFKLSLLILSFSERSFKNLVLVPLAALAIAFLTNGVRIMIMAILVAQAQPEAFEYWHQGDGSQIFAVISMVTFGIISHYITRTPPPKPQPLKELEKT